MGRTSQLQIRVSPEQKAALKRLAAAAGQSVSAYVLGRALPRDGDELIDALERLRKGWQERDALATLARLIPTLDPEDLEASLGGSALRDLKPPIQNCVAALAEWAALARGVEPPAWAAAVPPLARPYFRWPLESLRPYQIRVTPPAYKRRNLFDPGLPLVRTGAAARATALEPLAEHLAGTESEVEFYFIGGAVLWQGFPARPRSGRPPDLFAPAPDPVATFLTARGLARGWVPEALQTAGRRIAGGTWVRLERTTAFEPPPAYALAMKLACLPEPPALADLDDLRFLLRALNLGSPEAARSVVARYVADRHLPPHAQPTLAALLA